MISRSAIRMHLNELKFQRMFSKSMYKTLKLPMGEMTFTKDFVNDKHGDLYPVITKDTLCIERIENNRYYVLMILRKFHCNGHILILRVLFHLLSSFSYMLFPV